MKALAYFPQDRRLKVLSAPEPQIGSPWQVKIRMAHVGICGTDREIVSGSYGQPPDGEDHLILGHEGLGQVVEAGAHVELRAGDWVVPRVRRACSDERCKPCRAGRPDFCLTGRFLERGIKGLHGFMAEWVVEDRSFLQKISPALASCGALVEPLSIAEKAFEQAQGIQRRLPWIRQTPGFKAVVLGAGPVGLLGAMLLADRGFRTFVYSRESADSPNARVAGLIGARYLCSAEVSLRELADKTGNIDIVYEATGVSKLAFEALPYLGANGVFVFTGIPGHANAVEMDTDTVMRNLVLKNQVVLGTVNADADAFRAAAADLEHFQHRWPAALEALVTARYSPEQAIGALSGHGPRIKEMVMWKDPP